MEASKFKSSKKERKKKMKVIAALIFSAFLLVTLSEAVIYIDNESDFAKNALQEPPLLYVKAKLSSNLRVPEKNNSLSQLNAEVSERQVQEMEFQIESFISKLKSFVFRETFDMVGFNYEAKQIKLKLDKLVNLTAEYASNEEIAMLLKFAEYLFVVMEDSAKDLVYYNTSERPGHRCIYRMIELNVMLLAMRNSKGKLDVDNKNYENQLFQFWRSIHVWSVRFRLIQDVQAKTRLLFEGKRFETENELALLVSEFPLE